MMNFRLALTLMGATVLAGCAAGGANFNSRAYDMGTEPRKDVVIFFNAKSAHFTGALYDGFVAATKRRMESCGVRTTVLEFDPLEIDMRAKLDQTVERHNADTVLLFVRNGGSLRSDTGGVAGNLYFEVAANDTKRSKVVWKAVVDYRTLTKNMYIDDNLSAELFAAQFVSKLASDQVIQGCPVEATTAKQK